MVVTAIGGHGREEWARAKHDFVDRVETNAAALATVATRAWPSTFETPSHFLFSLPLPISPPLMDCLAPQQTS